MTLDPDTLKRYAASLGLDCVGIAPARLLAPPVPAASICPLAAGNGPERYEPERLLPGCRSVVVALFPYYGGREKTANLSQYCRSLDYHVIVGEYLAKLSSYIETHYGGTCRPAVDMSPLSDRLLAYEAGLGFIGDNGCLINGQYGSYVFIGNVLTTAAFAPDRPLAQECLHCGACRRACPGQCFSQATYDYRLCKSYLTQKKGNFTLPELQSLQKTPSIFGCDCCQEVCPHNASVPLTPLPEFHRRRLPFLRRQDIESLSNRQFQQAFGDRAFSWRGKKTLLRNMDALAAAPSTDEGHDGNCQVHDQDDQQADKK